MTKPGEIKVHRCQWNGCSRYAVTSLRTTLLPWMHVCHEHARRWKTMPYDELVEVVHHRQPVHGDPHGAKYANLTSTEPPADWMPRTGQRRHTR